MTADVFELAPHEQEQAAEPAPSPSPDIVELLADQSDPDKLPFLSWLWHHHVPGDEFYALAHLVLSGGPGDVWARKTYLVPTFVARDIAEFYAVDRPGITDEHLDQARKAIRAYYDSTETVSELIKSRREKIPQYMPGVEPAQAANREIKNVQTQGFQELGTMPAPANANTPTATITEVVPDVTEEDMPTDFRTVKVRCVFGVARGQRAGREPKMCGRPSVAGSMLCVEHGGIPLAYTQDELREIYNGARQRLIAATLMAVDGTIELAQNAVNETVRLKALEIILDRTGFVPGVEIHLPGTSKDGAIDKTPAQVVLERLNQLGIATPNVTPIDGAAADESDVVEAEVVGE